MVDPLDPPAPWRQLSLYDVLVVEDEETIRDLLVEFLEESGLEVQAVGCPCRGLALVSEPDGCTLLVTDIDLGVSELDGFEIAARARMTRPDLPVVFISGRTWRLQEHKATARDRMLRKPFNGTSFVATVHELLGQVARPA